jgi:hypothetical protein
MIETIIGGGIAPLAAGHLQAPQPTDATRAAGAGAAGSDADQSEAEGARPDRARRTAHEPLFNSPMEEHHSLGYEQAVSEHLKYLVWAQGRPIACLAWSSAPRHLGGRDRYIGVRRRGAATSAFSPTTLDY